LRVLLLHNRYRSAGGEERAVAQHAGLLRERGVAVEVLERDSGAVGRAAAARALLRGGVGEDAVFDAVRSLDADIVHAHNLHPLLGWRALAAARRAGARTVLTLHNYRLVCAIGVSYRDGGPCQACTGRATAPAVVHRCRGGVLESSVYATGLAVQQPRILREADRVVALSAGQLAALGRQGIDVRGLRVIPGWVPSVASRSAAGEGTYALAAGRLVAEKGFDTAILAARAAGVPLVIAGSGPDEPRLRALGGPVRFEGWVSEARMGELRAGAAVVLAPSCWEEVFPFTVLDALAAGVPALVSALGGLPELIAAGGGVVLPARDVGAWARALAEMWAAPTRRVAMGEAGLRFARAELGADRAGERLLALYAELLPSTRLGEDRIGKE
jgi:glycosyltransferase involved in cell wall biosynthesis